jgi:hypothetical protein
MNRPQQIREVFFELRRAVGDQASARELLQLASAIVRAYTEPEDDGAEPEFWGRAPFLAAEVDKAMMDGGWRVLDFECRCGLPVAEETPENTLWVQARLRRLVERR